jgi:hypothetical protein
MVRKLFCKTQLRVAISCIALAGLILAWPARHATARDSAPQWLHDAAQASLPAHDDDAVAVILLDDTEVTARDNGEIQTLHRRAFKILRPQARDEFGGLGVNFDADTKIAYMKAWTITPDGHDLAVTDKDAVEHGYLADIEYTDTKVKALKFPEADPGSVIGYEYVQQDRPYVFEDIWPFQHTIPVKQARFDLRLPPGWEYSAQWFNHADQAPQTVGANEYVWQVGEQSGVREEDDMPPWRTVAGWVGIKYFPRDPALRAKSAGTWHDIGLWYNGLTESRRDSNPAIHQKVLELTNGISEPLAQMQALTAYMQRNIRYFAVEIGIGGFQPHPASEVFAHQFGDCKDKATLLSTMLKEIGIDSYYVLVDDFREGVHPEYPSTHFNHVILAIRVPGTVNNASLYSTVQDAKLGKLLVFDPTNEYVPLGNIPSYLQNTYGLLMAPDGGTLIQLPLSAPATNRLLRSAKLSLTASGSLSGEVKEVRWGGPAYQGREQYLRVQPSKRQEVIEHFLQEFLPNFALQGASLGNLEQYNEVLTVDYAFASQGYARMVGDEMLVRPRVFGDKYAHLLELFAQKKPRKYPIEFDEATRQDDIFDITLPVGYVPDGELPATDASCDFGTYKSKVEVKDGVLHYTRTLEIQKVHVPAEKLADVKDFLQKIAVDQQMYVALKSGGTQAAVQ